MKSSYKTKFGKTRVLESNGGGTEKLIVVPGFTEGVTHTKKLLGALAAKGYDAISFSQPRKKGDKSLNPIERQSRILSDVLDRQSSDGEKVHGVAHSLGAAALLRVAQEQPDKFESITIMEPAGAVGRQDFFELMKRVGKKVVKNQAGAARGQNSATYTHRGHYTASADNESRLSFSNRVNTAQLAGLGTIAKNPAQAKREANAAGNYDMTDDVLKVRELGIPINIVTAHSDEMFDAEKVDARLQKVFESGVLISNVADPTARHDTYWMQAGRTAEIIDQTLHAANK